MRSISRDTTEELVKKSKQARGGETKNRRAKVDGCFRERDDDMALLQLTGGASPLALVAVESGFAFTRRISVRRWGRRGFQPVIGYQ